MAKYKLVILAGQGLLYLSGDKQMSGTAADVSRHFLYLLPSPALVRRDSDRPPALVSYSHSICVVLPAQLMLIMIVETIYEKMMDLTLSMTTKAIDFSIHANLSDVRYF